MGEADVDYAQRGRDLLARVHLAGADGAVVQPVERYSPVNAIWRHPTSGATLYVGNASTAASRDALAEINVSASFSFQYTNQVIEAYSSFELHRAPSIFCLTFIPCIGDADCVLPGD